MSLHLQKYLRVTRYLDPNNEYKEGSRPTEIRVDPLTGRTSRILNFPMRVPQKPDLTALANKSLEMGCPFCPEVVYKLTPKFPADLVAEGRISIGEALVFPNMFPYDTHSAVGIFSGQHFVPLTAFQEDMLVNGFGAGLEYLKRASSHQGRYGSINWNYMPLSGGSIIHPHIQVIAGDMPSNYQRETLAASKAYREAEGTSFWADLLGEEQQLGDRYIGATGNVQWLASYAPTGFMDIMALFPDRYSVEDLSREDLAGFARGLMQVFSYFDSKDLWSFNLALFSGIPGEEHYWTHARIVPRFVFSPISTSDVRYAEILHHEVMTTVPPEDLARDLRALLGGMLE